jgi:hypothetical protein
VAGMAGIFTSDSCNSSDSDNIGPKTLSKEEKECLAHYCKTKKSSLSKKHKEFPNKNNIHISKMMEGFNNLQLLFMNN